MHGRLLAEKRRLADDIGVRIELTLTRLYEHVDEGKSGATDLRDQILALTTTRDTVNRQSTWPWQPETPRWLLSALLVPLTLWGVTRFLERTGL